LDFTKKSSHARPVPKGGRYEESHYETVKEIFRYGTETFRDRVFILDKDKPRDKEFREYTYGDFREDVEALGTALTAKYMEKGAPLAIIGENQYDWYVSYMTALTGAGIAVPLDKELPDNEIEITLNRSKAEAVIFSAKLKDRILKLREKGRLPYVRTYVVMKSGDLLDDNVVGFDEVVREGKELIAGGDRSFIDTETDPDEFRALFFTSGTTSDAKGVMATSRQLANNINAVSAYVRINEQDRFFSVLPLHHTYESSIGYLLAVAYGSSIAVNQGLRYITQDLKDTRPSILIAVPLLIEHLYESIQKNIRKSKKEKIVESMMHTAKVLKSMGVDIRRRVFKEIYDGLGGNLEYIVSAAAPLDPKIGQWLTDLGIIFLQGYGLTETCPISAVTPEYDTRVGSAGKTIINGEIRVSNPDENGDGELVISTNTLMMGYFEDEAATNDAIEVDENGRRWFYSGDIGHVDEDGFVYITGRIKNVIVTQNGKNIYPEELEQLILENHDFSDCMVYGKEVPGEKELIVTARVIPNYDRLKEVYGDISTEEIYKLLLHDIRDVNKKTTNYKAIKNLEIKDGDYIRTSTKKIKRYREIKEGKILSISEPKGKV
ncbi:MAG: AMP-binding protein, partial [Anaerovoracaceae bacterium]|nr:AMP-binding protein [Anaerovoracaceae bacterium]